MNTSLDKLNYKPIDTRKRWEIWNGYNKFLCQGKVYIG
jgi:hypothetical protein